MKKRKNRTPHPKICPEHDLQMRRTQTKYGGRWECPDPLCDVVLWEGSTSMPAGAKIRQARIRAHDAFDALWRSGRYKRNVLYGKLAEFMCMSRDEAHIGQFDDLQCLKVLQFVEQMLEQATPLTPRQDPHT